VCRVDANRLDLGMRAVRQGASDVLAADEWSEEVWTRTLEALASNNTVIAHKAAAASAQSAQSGAADAEERSFVFVDPVSQKLLALAQRVAQAGVTTLLTGPTGAGKEVMARILHEASQRRDGPFAKLASDILIVLGYHHSNLPGGVWQWNCRFAGQYFARHGLDSWLRRGGDADWVGC
jgi:two-component system response regulator FlrC